MKTEQELARDLIEFAEANSFDGQPKAVIIDYAEYFGSGMFSYQKLTKECDELGYDVLPLKESVISIMPLIGKCVVQSKIYRGC